MPSQSPKPLKIFIFAVDGVGHLNACVGMAQALVKRGHRIFFLQNDAFAGQFSKFGFDEILLKSTSQGPPPGAGAPPTGDGAPKRNPVKEMAEHLIKSGMLSAKSPVEKLRDQLKDGQAPAFMDKIYNTLVEHNPQIADCISVFAEMPFGGSPYLNIYGYPEELDYHDIVPRPDKFAIVDAFIREVPEPFQLPEQFVRQSADDKLIYVSLGSMGSVDVDLMKRILSALAKSPHKYIVSKGPRANEYELPDNCLGKDYLPQTRILPLVDLVITHGGNNTITETFSFGKPMIVLPLFADQYDNAQRVTEKGYGARLEPYAFKEDELINTIDRLLNDKEMIARGRAAANRIANSNSKENVCEVIEKIVSEFNTDK